MKSHFLGIVFFMTFSLSNCFRKADFITISNYSLPFTLCFACSPSCYQAFRSV